MLWFYQENMMTKETGVPAFPIDAELCQDLTIEEQRGMTLRDYFAAKAMQAFIHGFSYREDKDNIVIPNNLSQHAYEMADAMLKARK
jgi:hypothetical protein